MASRLLAGLEQVDQVAAQRVPDAVTTSWQAFVVRVDASVDRDRVISRLAAAGVESTIGTYALHREPAFAEFHRPEHRLDVSAQLADTTLALPLHPGLTDADAERVVVELARALQHEARD